MILNVGQQITRHMIIHRQIVEELIQKLSKPGCDQKGSRVFVNSKVTKFDVNDKNIYKGEAKEQFLRGLGSVNKTNGHSYPQVIGGSAGLDYSTDKGLNHGIRQVRCTQKKVVCSGIVATPPVVTASLPYHVVNCVQGKKMLRKK